ncbi:MAG: PorT family protein [Chitinophagaceae bacterium]|nr:PorT family protein [Chitinophagaceae bacterium]
MKQTILLFSFLAVSGMAFSQLNIAPGVKAGVTSYTLKGDAVESLGSILQYTDGIITPSSRTGFFIGGYTDIPLTENISVEPGIYFSQKGYQLKGGFEVKGVEFIGANAKADLLTQYIDVPVYLKGNFNGFQVFAGPQLSYLTNAQLKTTAGALGINFVNETTDISDRLNRWDAGIIGGIGYLFSNGMNISASYDYGLMKADANKRADAFNRGFKIGLGVQF